MLVFITGPVRSGKSRFAQTLARKSGRRVTYVATARKNPEDAEWAHRIARHQADRPPEWPTFESAGEPFIMLERLFETSSRDELLLVDSLGTWLSNLCTSAELSPDTLANETLAFEETLIEECDRFISLLSHTHADCIVVSEETGWGIVPAYPSGRVFRDVLGRCNQALAERAGRAYLVVCGRALELHHAQRTGEHHD